MVGAVLLTFTVGPGIADAGVKRAPLQSGKPAVVPTSQAAVIYDTFPDSGSFANDGIALKQIADGLQSEGYDVHSYGPVIGSKTAEDLGPTYEGPGSISSFLSIAKAGVAIIDTHGVNLAAPQKAKGVNCKGVSRAPVASAATLSPSPPSGSDLSVINGAIPLFCSPLLNGVFKQPWILVQIYPFEQEAIDEYHEAITTEGINRSYLQLATVKLTEYTAPVYLFLMSRTGIDHYFMDNHLALADGMFCHSLTFASSFHSLSFYGYIPSTCSADDVPDTQLLWSRLFGKAGVSARSTTEAENLKGFKEDLLLAPDSSPVVLSPAVVSVGPKLLRGGVNDVIVNFDAKMHETSDAVDVSGCGASVSGQKWESEFSLDVTVQLPQDTTDGSATLTVKYPNAVAEPGTMDNDKLDGNQNSAQSGLAPNRNNYVTTIPCGSVPKGCPITSAEASQAFGGPAMLLQSSGDNGSFGGCTYGRAGYVDDALGVQLQPGSKENFETYTKDGWTPVAGIGEAAAVNIGSYAGTCVVLTQKKTMATVTLRLASAPGDAGVIVLPSFSDMKALCADVASNIP
jgi:hypothetical protein